MEMPCQAWLEFAKGLRNNKRNGKSSFQWNLPCQDKLNIKHDSDQEVTLSEETGSQCKKDKRKPMSTSFAFATPAHILATFFGSGLLRPASGTWGTLAGFVFFLLLNPFLNTSIWVAIIIVTFFVGVWACRQTCNDFGVHDHSSVVIDEVFAIWLVLIFAADKLVWQIAGFCLFRFFDIIKIPPARYFDSSPAWRNGWGIMLDDLVAAVQSIIVLCLLRLIPF